MATLLRAVADRGRGDPALIDERGSTSWASFNERVNRLVNGLRAGGLGPGDTIAMIVGNQREFFEVVAAAVHGGWIFVPVNWHWVGEEVAYVLGDSKARALIVDARYCAVGEEAVRRTPGCAIRLAIGGTPPDGFRSYEGLLASASPDDLAEERLGGPMFYTSGTTGLPKGVRGSLSAGGPSPSLYDAISHAVCAQLGIASDGAVLLCGPAYHSAQWAFSFFPLLTGNTVVMQHQFDPVGVLDLIDRHHIQHVHFVPTQFVRLLKLDAATKASFDGSSLRVAYHGAAPCPPDVKRAMLDWWGPKITEYYGGTEGGFLSLASAEEWLARPGSVGKPLANVEIVVVKDDGSRAAANEPGQIYFRNRLGADFEYHNAPEKTAAAHLEPGLGTLGDVGYLDPDGYLFLSDRKIDMIISGGVNIYPAEIEAVLIGHAAVADAAVFGVPHDEMGEAVKAAVELLPGVAPSAELAAAIIAHCRLHLAGYKTPRSVDFEVVLPRSPTGKLYKRLLRDRYWQGVERRI